MLLRIISGVRASMSSMPIVVSMSMCVELHETVHAGLGQGEQVAIAVEIAAGKAKA